MMYRCVDGVAVLQVLVDVVLVATFQLSSLLVPEIVDLFHVNVEAAVVGDEYEK
jgi:hypothetical protein